MNELLIIGAVFLGSLFLLYGLGVGVGISMIGASIIGWIAFDTVNVNIISNQLIYGLNSFTYLAIPFYVFLGRLMNSFNITERIFRFAASFVGQFRGGIAYVNVIASMFFAGMSGLATADVAGLGRIEYTAMREYGYEKGTAIGVTGMSSVIGPIIPPSVPVIVYAVLAEESISDLFLAGILPGIVLGLVLMVFIYILALYNDYSAVQEFELREVYESLKPSFFPLLTPVIIIGGILSGWFTATEAGAIGIIYVLILGYFIDDDFSTRKVAREARDSMIETCALTFLLAAAALYGLVALQIGVPQMLAGSVLGLTQDPTLVTLLMVGIFLLIGTFMGAVAGITVTTPIVLPIVLEAGVDPVHFGIIMIVTFLFGQLTPPFGTILFVLEKVTDATLEEVMKGVVPFYLPMAVVLLLVIFISEISLYIPQNF